jgi:hypothetical protein
MKKLSILVLLLLIPLATAFPCESIPDEFLCLEIQNDQELTLEEKEELYNSLMSIEFPDFEFVYNYNTNIEFTSPPENVSTTDSMQIKNAWLSIITVMPSVLIEDQLYSQEQGTLLTAYNYDTELPSGLQGNDCKTLYSISEQTEELSIYKNGDLIGHDLVQDYTINNDSNFLAQLLITSVIRVRHYQDHQGHCYIGEYCPSTCEYSHTTYQTAQITLEDELELFYYDEQPLGEVHLLDQITSSYHGEILAENYTALDLGFANSEYNLRNYYYDFDFSYKPYYVLTIKANEEQSEFIDNIIVGDLDFFVKDINSAVLTLYNHFGSFEYPLTFNFNDEDLVLETDKNFYEIGETILVTSNLDAEIEYNGETLYGNEVEFTASQEDHTIKAYYGNKQDTRMIFVANESWIGFYNLGFFGMLIFLINKIGLFFMRRIGF